MMPTEALLDIVHEDPDFVVVDKPSGMLSVPGRGPEKRDCVCARVRSRDQLEASLAYFDRDVEIN